MPKSGVVGSAIAPIQSKADSSGKATAVKRNSAKPGDSVPLSGYGRVAKKVKSTTVPDRQAENLKQAHREKAATKVQRAFRKWQKKRLMQMAAQAIEDSERIMLDRQRLNHIANIDVSNTGRRPQVRQSLDPHDKLLWDPVDQKDFSAFAATSNAENSKSPRNQLDGASDKLDSASDKDNASDGEENKLAALNEMLKAKKFQIQSEDEEDFEMFL